MKLMRLATVTILALVALSQGLATPVRAVSKPSAYNEVIAGGTDSCGLKAEHSVSCWGDASTGIPGMFKGKFSQLAVLPLEACGLRATTVTCWGETSLAFPRNVSQFSLTETGAVDSTGEDGFAGGCAVTDDYSVVCVAETGNEDVNTLPLPTFSGQYVQVASAPDYACGITTQHDLNCAAGFDSGQAQGMVPSARFLSLSSDGIDDQMCGISLQQRIICWGPYSWTLPSGKFQSVSVGSGFACAISIERTMRCFGNVPSGEPKTGDVASVSAGDGLACLVAERGQSMCWGANQFGQATVPTQKYEAVSMADDGTTACAVQAGGMGSCWGGSATSNMAALAGKFKQVAASDSFACGLLVSKKLSCFGAFPKHVPVGKFKQVAVGATFGCALSSASMVKCWGRGALGQTKPPHGAFTSITAGYDDACGLQHTVTVRCWGDNDFGQINAPTGEYSQVSAGYATTCALRENGSIDCWGRSVPGDMSPPKGVFSDVRVGVDNACAVQKSNGAVVCWGSGPLSGGGPGRSLAVGNGEACGIRPNGDVVCWGSAVEVL